MFASDAMRQILHPAVIVVAETTPERLLIPQQSKPWKASALPATLLLPPSC